MAVAWQRVGNQLRCTEHGETFPLARRCPACPLPDTSRPATSPKRDTSPTQIPVERAAAASFLANAPGISDGHPLFSREGRMAAAAELYDRAEAAIEDGLQQPQMNAIKEARQCLALVESLSGTAEVAAQVAALSAQLAELRARMDGAQDDGGIAPPLDDGDAH